MGDFVKRIYTVLSLVLFCFGFIACDSKEDSEEAVKVIDIAGITNVITQGTWQVTNYVDTNVDETANYADYTFTFNADGTVGATDGNSASSGAWVLTNPENNIVKLRLFFSAPDVLEELSDNWGVSDFSNVMLALSDDDTSGTTEILSFHKK